MGTSQFGDEIFRSCKQADLIFSGCDAADPDSFPVSPASPNENVSAGFAFASNGIC
jgi:hypothetical protein